MAAQEFLLILSAQLSAQVRTLVMTDMPPFRRQVDDIQSEGRDGLASHLHASRVNIVGGTQQASHQIFLFERLFERLLCRLDEPNTRSNILFPQLHRNGI